MGRIGTFPARVPNPRQRMATDRAPQEAPRMDDGNRTSLAPLKHKLQEYSSCIAMMQFICRSCGSRRTAKSGESAALNHLHQRRTSGLWQTGALRWLMHDGLRCDVTRSYKTSSRDNESPGMHETRSVRGLLAEGCVAARNADDRPWCPLLMSLRPCQTDFCVFVRTPSSTLNNFP